MNPPIYTPDTDPQFNLRSDLWHTMDVSQLTRQQELAVDKATKIQSIMGAGSSPSLITIHKTLQQVITDLSKLIDKNYSN